MNYKDWSTAFKGTISGAVSGFLEVWFTFPFEYVKTQLQLDSDLKNKKLYDGAIDCIQKTLKTRGFFGFYFGFPVYLYGNIPKTAARFGGFEYFRSHMADENGHLNSSGKLLCGVGSGFCEAILASTPMETIKVKFSNDRSRKNPQFKGFIHGVRTIIKQEGFSGLYKGVTPTIVKQCSNQAIRFSVVETCKDYYRGDDHKMILPNVLVGAFGAFAGGVSVLANTPVDVVKSRMQSFEGAKYRSTLDCVLAMWKYEGAIAFYKGTLPRLTRVCFDEGLTFMIYDWCMDQLGAACELERH